MQDKIIDWQFNDEYYKWILVPQMQRINDWMIFTQDYGSVLRELSQMFQPLASPIKAYKEEIFESINKNIQDAQKLNFELGNLKIDTRRPTIKRVKLIAKKELELVSLLNTLQQDIYGALDKMNMFFKRSKYDDRTGVEKFLDRYGINKKDGRSKESV